MAIRTLEETFLTEIDSRSISLSLFCVECKKEQLEFYTGDRDIRAMYILDGNSLCEIHFNKKIKPETSD